MSKATTTTAPSPETRRDALFASATRVFAAKGYAATKIADIAAAAGVSQGLLYRYYPSKEALFTELIRTSFEQIDAAADGLEQHPDPPDVKIATALTTLLTSMEVDSTFSDRVLLIAQASISEGIPEPSKALLRSESAKPYETVARIMESGQRAGTVAAGPPMVLATLFWTTIKGLALHKVALGEAFRAPDTALVLRMFLNPSTTQIESSTKKDSHHAIRP